MNEETPVKKLENEEKTKEVKKQTEEDEIKKILMFLLRKESLIKLI